MGEKQSETYSSPTLPKRAETFAGFDEKRAKSTFPCSRDVGKLANLQVLSPRLQELEEKREMKSPQPPPPAPPPQTVTSVMTTVLQFPSDANTIDTHSYKDHNYAALQVSHHLQTLLCIISQQMTTMHSLQLQLALYRESPKAVYTHNDQLEELRNLQDKLQEEKTTWLRQKELQEQELEERSTQQAKLLEQIKIEQEDIKQQRDKLYRKMELLSNQGLLLSPSTPLMIGNPTLFTPNNDDSQDGAGDGLTQTTPVVDSTITAGTVDRRKDKWRTSSTTSKTPPSNLLSATNAPKSSQTSVKQKIPMKLSSFSSASTSKIDKSASFNYSSTSTVGVAPSAISQNASPSSASVTQMLPLKLADKRSNYPATAQQVIPQHSRTGSSPAIIQHPASAATSPTSVSVTRTDSASTFTFGQKAFTPSSSRARQKTSSSPSFLPTAVPTSAASPSITNAKPEEEEIYF